MDNNFIDSANIQVDINKIWEKAKDLVITKVTGVAYDVWINTLEPVDLKDNNILLKDQNLEEIRDFARIAGEDNLTDEDIKYGLTYGRSVIADYVI